MLVEIQSITGGASLREGSMTGNLLGTLQVGKSVIVENEDPIDRSRNYRRFCTSTVTGIDATEDGYKIETLNSTYILRVVE